MKYLHRLVKNGNSTQVSIPTQMLHWLQWRAGEPVVVELTVERTVIVRLPTVEDLHIGVARSTRFGALPEARP